MVVLRHLTREQQVAQAVPAAGVRVAPTQAEQQAQLIQAVVVVVRLLLAQAVQAAPA